MSKWLDDDPDLEDSIFELIGDKLWKTFASIGGWTGGLDTAECVKKLCADYGSPQLGRTWFGDECIDSDSAAKAYAEMLIIADEALSG